MAGCTFPCPATINHLYSNSHSQRRIRNYTSTKIAKQFSFRLPFFYSSTIDYSRSFSFKHSFRSGRCYAINPQSKPPSKNNPPPPSGRRLTKFQDSSQIFFAVLFWMSLFFWSCAWDGKNDGRSNKGPRFKK